MEKPPREDEGIRDRLREYLPDLVRRTLVGGLGAVFSTEEGIRRIVQEAHLPKEVASYLLEQAQATKREVYRILATELREWLERVDLERLLVRVLTSLTFEITTQVRLLPNENGLVRPEIKPRLKVRRRRDAEEAESEDEDGAESGEGDEDGATPSGRGRAGRTGAAPARRDRVTEEPGADSAPAPAAKKE